MRAAALLSEIGDCRERFTSAESLACLAGAAPSTRASGKHRAVSFRWAADKKLREAVIDFAGDSRHANPWAADLYAKASAGQDQSPRRAHPGPRLVRRDLALLAGTRSL